MLLLAQHAIHQFLIWLCHQHCQGFAFAKLKCIGPTQQILVEIVQIIVYSALQIQHANNVSQQLINGMLQRINAKDYAKIYHNIIIQQADALLALTLIVLLAI